MQHLTEQYRGRELRVAKRHLYSQVPQVLLDLQYDSSEDVCIGDIFPHLHTLRIVVMHKHHDHSSVGNQVRASPRLYLVLKCIPQSK